MRGHQPLIALRMSGLAPDLVSIATEPSPWRDFENWPEWTDVPQIEIEPGDNLRRLDLRFLVAIEAVMVAGVDRERVDAIADACLAAGAKRVLAFAHELYPGTGVTRSTATRFEAQDGRHHP
jgi:hypothetical protein